MIKIFFLLFSSFAIFRIYRYNIPEAFGQSDTQTKKTYDKNTEASEIFSKNPLVTATKFTF